MTGDNELLQAIDRVRQALDVYTYWDPQLQRHLVPADHIRQAVTLERADDA